MRSLPEIVAELGLKGEAEVLRWVEAECVRPEPGEGFRFRAIDVARLRLIRELDRDLAVDPEAIPVVLDLLDQVYDLRRRVRALARRARASSRRRAARLGGAAAGFAGSDSAGRCGSGSGVSAGGCSSRR